MNEQDEPRETQHELFEEFSSAPKKPERFPSIAKTHKPILFSTTLEQILLFSILGILLLCGIFFLGVLRGKALKSPTPARQAAPPPQSADVRKPVLPAGRPASPAPVPAAAKTALRQAAPAAPNVVSVAQKPYTIQLVTHRKKELAEQEMAAIRKLGYVSFLIPSGEYYQVCAGQYAAKEEAKKDTAYFSGRYKDCFLRHR